jgi:hypothetical protein
MLKKFPLILALFIALLLPVKSYSQKTTSKGDEWSSLPPAKVIDKLQTQIIDWQDEIIRGMEVQIIMQNIYRDMVGLAVDPTNGDVKDQKILDLVSKYGIGVSTKDGKKLNTPSTDAGDSAEKPETVPFVEVGDKATSEEKARIRALLEKGQTLVEKATNAKKVVSRLETVAMDLLALSKTDDGAQTLVKKYSIKQNAPTPSPSP